MSNITPPDLPEDPVPNGRFLSGYMIGVRPPSDAPGPRLSFQSTHADTEMAPALAPAPVATRLEAILGESNLLPFHFLRTGDRIGRAVVKIRRGDGACGTGFLVAPDVLVTNHHILPDIATAAEAVAVANHEDRLAECSGPLGCGTPLTAIEVALAPERLFVTEGELDFTFCGVIGLESQGTIPLDRSVVGPGPSEAVNIIQHPRGRPKEVAIRHNQVVKTDGVVLHYVCDTEPGSSGSPVFDNSWRLVALHHASIVAVEGNGGRRGAGGWSLGESARFLNEGVRLAAIARWLESDAADGSGADLRRLRGLFQGIDPRSGFFGALGRSPGHRSVAEFVAETIVEPGEALDVAFWDLRALRHMPFERLGELGLVMAAMGMDVWLLSHTSAAQARVLAEHLDTFFRHEHRVVTGARERLAVVERAAVGFEVRPVDAGGPGAVSVIIRRVGDRTRVGIGLMPLVRGGPSAVQDCIDALRKRGDDQKDWLLIGGRSARLGVEARAGLAASGLNIAEASGASGGLVLVRSAASPVDRIFASPGLKARSGGVQIVRDRELPEAAKRIAGRSPIAVRIVFRKGK